MFLIISAFVTSTLFPTFQSHAEKTAGMEEVRAYTGIEFSDGSYVHRYSSGWDERYLMLVPDDQEITHVLASVELHQTNDMPRDIDGMNPMNVWRWWQPRAIKSYDAYQGTLQGTTNAFGRFTIVVERRDTPKHVVYVYFFKT